MTLYTLTTPPSANNLFRNVPGKGRVKTDRYKRWLEAAAWEVRLQHTGPALEGPTAVSITLKRPSKNSDLDNRAKGPIDALQAGGAIANDKQVTCLTMAWANHPGCRVTVSGDVTAE